MNSSNGLMNIKIKGKQAKAWDLLQNPNIIYTLLDGGARSGKSHIIATNQILLARDFSESRHLVARLRFSHAKTSIWHETYRPLMNKLLYRDEWKENKADYYFEFSNGSEIWLGGFDEKERTEKILGHEYNTIYLNEVSQLSYKIYEMAIPRLAKYNEGLINKAYFDCNPPSSLHWIHRIFYEKVDPNTLQSLSRSDIYDKLKLNPIDNIENLAPNYIENTLDILSDRAKRRFKYGEYVKAEGTIYERFDERHIIKRDTVPSIEFYTVGVDFALHMAAVLVGWVGDHIYILDDVGGFNVTSSAFNKEIQKMCGDIAYTAYCDPSGGERLQEITNSDKANNSVEPGIDYINKKIERDEFHICDNATGTLSEIYDYRRDDKERVWKENDHYMDSMRYAIFSYAAEPPQIFL